MLTAVAHGQSNAEIASGLFLSQATVKTHVSRLLMKLQARDRAQLVMVAYETGLVAPAGCGGAPALDAPGVRRSSRPTSGASASPADSRR